MNHELGYNGKYCSCGEELKNGMKCPNDKEMKMIYHELTEKIFGDGKCTVLDNADKIIRQWLTEKLNTIPTTSMIDFKSHFGLTKTSCKCGACTWTGQEWKFGSQFCTSNFFYFCPACGEKLGAV